MGRNRSELADRRDPLSQPGLEEKFNTLRRNILELEEEAEEAALVPEPEAIFRCCDVPAGEPR